MTTATQQNYGATFAVIDGELTVTNVFPVPADWDGYRFNGYCRPTSDEIRAAGYEPELELEDGVEVRGLAPNGETMYRWTEPDGSVWEDYWHPVPGGGLVMGHQVGGAE